MDKQAGSGFAVNQGGYPVAVPGQQHVQYGYYPQQQQQPAAAGHFPHGAPLMPNSTGHLGAWSTGLFDCFDDLPLCCLTCWCPCITFGRIAEIVDKGTSTCGTAGALYALIFAFTGCQFIYSCTYHTKMRHQYAIPGDDIEDFCIHFWCEPCSLCQEYKELTIRGFNVPLGWHGNMAMQNQAQGVPMAPVTPLGMTR